MEERKQIFQSLQQYTPPPPQNVWTKIERCLDAPKKSFFSRHKNWIIGVAVGLFVSLITLYFVLQPDKEKNASIVPSTEAADIIQKPSTVQEVYDSVLSITNIIPQHVNANSELFSSIETEKESLKKEEKALPVVIEQKSAVENQQEPIKTVQPKSVIVSKDSIKDAPMQEEPKQILSKETGETTDFQLTDSVVVEQPVFVELNQDQKICRGENAILRITQGKNVVWNTGATSSIITVNPTETTTYKAHWEQNNQCYQGEITVTILNCSIFVPNAFSPNGDGVNDVFRPVGDGITNYDMLIFGINGERLFETKDFSFGWDGRNGNAKMKEGVYIYRISFQDETGQRRNLQGSFNLLP